MIAFQSVEQQFFPASNRPELLVDLWLPQGASMQATEDQVKAFEALLQQNKDIANYVAYVGGGSPRFYLPLNQEMRHDNLAQFVVMTRGNEVREQVFESLSRALGEQFLSVRGRVNRLQNGPPVGYPVQFRVTGKEPATLRRVASEVNRVVRDNPWTININQNWNELGKEVKLEIDQNKARVLGISSQELSQVLYSILSGFSITRYREGNRLIEVIIRAEKGKRLLPDNIADIDIPTASGKFVPLGQIARIHYVQAEPIIWRRDRFATITVQADVQGRIQAHEVTKQIDPQLDPIRKRLPDGYRIEIGGAVEASTKAELSIQKVMPFAFMVVLTVLMIQLQSFQRVLLVLLTAPLGMIGVTIALLAGNIPFGFVATLGVIALFGMIMRNAVILVDQIEQDISQGHDRYHAIIDATVRRFRPIALTAAAAVLAMIPLSQSNFWGPMAVAIMGGLMVATVLTLLFLPALYAAWFKVKPASLEP